MNATHKVQRKAHVSQLTEAGWVPLHTGVVVGETTTHVRVFNIKEDVGPHTAEWFPRQSNKIRTVVL